MLVEYDQRQAVNRMARYLCDEVPIFKGRIQSESNTIAKGDKQNLFTSNAVKRAVIAMFSEAKTNKPNHASRMIELAPEVWRKRLVHYFTVFTRANPEWSAVAQLQASAGQQADLPKYREEYLHFHASGLLAIAGVGEAILKLDGDSKEESLTARQVATTECLARLNWRRDNPIWQEAGILVNNLFVGQRGFNDKAIRVIKPRLA